ncbi:MAG: hypothetical protein ACFFCO_11070, partial [Promethearchaeota archaeon]
MVSKRTALILIVIIAAASIAGIVLIGPLFVPPPTDYQGHIVISEVNYLPTGADEFLELYMWENTTTLNLYGWTITVPTGTFALQPVTGLSIFDFILIRFGTGTSDLDASDGVATIYLGTTITDALPNAGEATLTSATGQQIDYVRWGGGSSVRGARSWPASDPGPTANTSESIQLFGVDTDSSTNWLSAQPTPGYQNALQWYIPNLGYGFVLGNGVYNITTPDRPWFPLANDTEFQVTGHGVNAPMIQKIREMLNFTANFYETMGFPRPVNDTDGRIHVTVVNGTTPFTQATSDDWGRIKIFIGTNSSDIEIKVAVEHEMFHLVQWHREKNSAGDIVTNMPEPPSDNNWWEEGMAEYWGIRSTMANYEKTMEEVQQARRDVGSTNWWDHGRNLTTDIFDPCQWDQHWDDYQTAFQFIKFLMEKYGFKSVLAIHLAAKYNRTVDTTVVSARDALEAVLGQSLNKILAQFYFWRVFNRQGGVLPPVIINEYISIASKPSDPHSVNITETAPRGGALVQHIVHNGTNPVTIDTKTAANSNWTVIVIIHHRDGTNTTVTYITDGTQPTIEVNPQVSNVTDVIKIRHLNANSNYINISINEQSDP